jgi:hypothetical protein
MVTLNFESDKSSNVTIELDIFSGRPNPWWTVRPDDQAKLVTLLRDDLVGKARSDAVPSLGYRGFIVRFTSDHSEIHIHVFDGSIEFDGKSYRDKERAIERFIISTMPRELKERFKEVMPNLMP